MGCYNSCVVDAPVDEVWAVLRAFHDMAWAAPVINRLEKVGDAAGDQIGAKRVLNGAFHETLHGLDDVGRVMTYSIDDGPDAVSKNNVSGYVGLVRVLPVTLGDATFVEWSSSWQDGRSAVKEFCDPIYKALLDALTQHFAAS